MNLNPKLHTKPLAFFLATNKKELPLIALNSICYGLGTLSTIGMVFYVGRVIDSLQAKNLHSPQLTSLSHNVKLT